MHLGQVTVRYRAGDWDECEQLAGAIPELVTTLTVAALAIHGLPVQIARGRSVAAKRLRQLAAFTGVDPVFDTEVALYEAELATWQGHLDRARSAIQRALASADAIEHPSEAAIVAWVCIKGLTAEAERAEGARAAGDAAALTDAIAVGHELLERARAAAERAKQTADAHNVYVVGHLAKAEAEWTRLQGRSDPKAWQAAIDAFSFGHVYAVARCRWRLAEALLRGHSGTSIRVTVHAPRRYREAGCSPAARRPAWRRRRTAQSPGRSGSAAADTPPARRSSVLPSSDGGPAAATTRSHSGRCGP